MTFKKIFFVAIAVELFSIYLLAACYPFSRLTTWMITGCHLTASFIAALSLFKLPSRKKKLMLFVMITTISVPLLGYLIVFKILDEKVDAVSDLFVEYRRYISLTPPGKENLPPLRGALDYLFRHAEIEPFCDSMESEDFHRKMNLIKNLGKVKGRSSVKSLNSLLLDDHMDVRYYAGEEISRVADRFGIFINQVKEEIKKDPGNPNLYLELGNLLMDYSLSGLLESESSLIEMKEAKKSLIRSIKLDSKNRRADFLLAKTFHHLKDYDGAVENYLNIIKDDPDNIPCLMGICESLWQKREFESAGFYLNHLEAVLELYDGADGETLKKSLELWKTGMENAQ